ncbi:hypothetical protein A2U01_0107641, partial [Trifolium medium]|nr:hypothetical protein [Trifolium medium]
TKRPMAGVNNDNVENVAENQVSLGPTHPQNGQLASVTESDDLNYIEYVAEPPMETVMAALVNAINHQG